MTEHIFEKSIIHFYCDGLEIMPPIINSQYKFCIGERLFSNKTEKHYTVEDITTIIVYHEDKNVWLITNIKLVLKN